MNAKMIEALKEIGVSLNKFVEEAEKLLAEPAEIVKEETVKVKDEPKKAKKVKEEPEVVEEASGGFTEEQLAEYTYNNLKKLAKDLGIPATGTRDELTKKILGAEIEPAEEEVEEVEEVEEEEVIEEEEVDEEEAHIVAKVHEAVEGWSDEDLMDLLTDIGVKARGKRQALIALVVREVLNGNIALEEDDEDTDIEETEEEVTEEVTEERAKAIEALLEDTRIGLEDGDLTREDLVEWLQAYHEVEEDLDDFTEDDLVSEYVRALSSLIDDEGEMHTEAGAYLVGGTPYCCGNELQYSNKSKTFSCSVCESEYETE